MPVDIRLTYEDYCLLPNDGKRYEIIDGELLVSPSPNLAHQRVVTRLTRFLSAYAEDKKLGEVFVAPFDVVFSRFDVVEPDILYISKAHSSVLTKQNVQGSPDLAVEVLSPSTADIDRTAKLKLYARFAVLEYWLIDPDGPSVEIYRREEKTFDRAVKLGPDDSLSSPLFPGFTLPLRRLTE
jgi:Uma2 family endonuclease